MPFTRGSFLSPTSSGATMQHVKVGRLTKTGSKERSGTVQKLTFKSFFEVLSMNNVTTYCTFIHLFRWSGLTFLPTDLNEDKIRIPFFFFQGQPVAVVQISSCTGKLLTTSEVTGISPQLERYYFHHAVEIHSSGTEKDRALHTWTFISLSVSQIRITRTSPDVIRRPVSCSQSTTMPAPGERMTP